MRNGINIYDATSIIDLICEGRSTEAYREFARKMRPQGGHAPHSSIYRTLRDHDSFESENSVCENDNDDGIISVLRKGGAISHLNSDAEELVRQKQLSDFLVENNLRHSQWINSVHIATNGGLKIRLGPLELMRQGRRTVAVLPKRREACPLFSPGGGLTAAGYCLSAAWHLAINRRRGRLQSGRPLVLESMPQRTLLLEMSKSAGRSGPFPKAAYVDEELKLFLESEVNRFQTGLSALDELNTRYAHENVQSPTDLTNAASRLDAGRVLQYELFID